MYFILPDSSTLGSDCTSGNIRLHQYQDASSSREGRLEICLNRAWGTVCNTRFDLLDTEVACSQLAGFSGQGVQNMSVGESTTNPLHLFQALKY